MKYYIVDAFSEQPFSGNPAGVCLLERPLSEARMLRIAAENNLSETAFVVPRGGNEFDLRWFTPVVEMDLCGHATLGSAFVVANFVRPGSDEIRFFSMSGLLTVTRRGDLYEMDFPARAPEPVAVTPQMAAAIGAPVSEAHEFRDLFLVVDSADTVANLKPDLAKIAEIPGFTSVVVMARGGPDCDFVSRCFAPLEGIPEDPVTGSTHASMVPFWAARLGKQRLTARQLSARGGTLYCENAGDRVRISGHAALYLSGELHVPEED